MLEHVLTLITFLPLLGMAAILCLPKSQENSIRWTAAIFSGLSLILACWLWVGPFDSSVAGMQFVEKAPWIPAINANYAMGMDGLSLPLIFLSALIHFIAVFASWGITKSVKGYFALLLLLEVGVNGVFLATDFFLFYVFWEIMLLPMYFLIGIWGGPKREYAAIKFFLYTLFGSVLMLVAMVAIWLKTGGLNGGTFDIIELQQLAKGWAADPSTFLGMKFTTWIFWFLFTGFAIKIPVFPFHTWLPDAHVQAPTPISVILAGILLKLGAYGMLRINFPLAPDAFQHFAWVLATLGVVNIVYGAYVAMAQTDFKRLVAYSSVSHMGYFLLGVAAMTFTGLNGATLQLFTHGTSSAMLFLIVGVIYDRAHHRDLNDFGGLAKRMPYFLGIATIGIFAGLGLPTMSGFISEAMTLMGSYGQFPVHVILSTLGILMTAAFLLYALQRVFLGALPAKYENFKDMSGREAFTLIPFAFLCILIGVMPSLILDKMAATMQSIQEMLSYTVQ
ncbi:MAG: NADH-quinone oxidoreductase subunit M [Planctomycetes bacterium]|jgi:NADH-quinone oxidoreductase subunit M|nr:NADH-quinone oxidoreductase subunit M [Planctomycetota bacterium]MBT4029081.1 NADH-quinone oxidoreductase subunit M [Planctomycetota bacterium]MBT4560299.1 NADH-quinone oxidoreductase subunit M [Planctomycetota bacterium]MBT5101883.1 NADH-quinone oxidoreductase subunit M [Planctomycetota bacterium]MBT5119340.1 NADH-quinone oxidoreductase subunit M [Planctomycetota bacterium]